MRAGHEDFDRVVGGCIGHLLATGAYIGTVETLLVHTCREGQNSMGYKGLWYLRVLAPDKRLYSSRSAGANRALYSHLEGNAHDAHPFTCG